MYAGFPKALGDGERPTVACDGQRVEPGPFSGRSYQVAYITQVPGGAITVKTLDRAAVNTTILPKFVVHPYTSSFIGYSNPLHARILESQVKGQSSASFVVYAIVDQNGSQLVEYALTAASTFSGVSCESGTGYVAKHSDHRPASADSVPTGCQHLINAVNAYSSNFLWQKCYDTAKYFIETCPQFAQSWRAFDYMNGAVQGFRPQDTAIYFKYQQWLKSVLYLNTSDPEYFCACVEAFGGTFQYAGDSGEQAYWRTGNRELAVVQWLLQHTNCDTGMLKHLYRNTRDGEYQAWLNDTTIKLDTTLPSMHDLGLDSMLNLHLGVSLAQSPFAASLSTVHLSADPFTARTNLLFEFDKMVYLKAKVYEELGRMLIGDGSGHSFEPGRHQIPIDLSAYPAGAYYVRIVLGDGETKTIKMIKQE